MPEQEKALELDWFGYYAAFEKANGGEPVQYNDGYHLFQTGYMYSRTDPRGPEISPPDDPEKLRELKTHYWKLRRNLVRDRLEYYEQLLRNLQQLQMTRSVPLQAFVTTFDDDGNPRRVSAPLDFSAVEAEIAAYKSAQQLCQSKLRELRHER